jgi:hypothetical protein
VERIEHRYRGKGEVSTLDARTKAIGGLQRVCSEFAELLVELKESDIEVNALRIFRDTLDDMRKTASTLQQGLERSRLSPDNQGLLALLIEARLRTASQLNTDIGNDFESGQIRTDQDGLSVYLLVLNQVMEQLDLMFGSRKAKL